MSGLILKDLLNLKSYSKIIVLFVVIFGAVSFYSGSNANFFANFFLMFFLMLTITTFSYDSSSKWELYAMSFPVGRKRIVLSKYVLALILTLAGFLVSALLTLLTCLGQRSWEGLAAQGLSALLVASGGLITLSVVMPLVFRFGAEKSRFLMMLIFIIPWIGLSVFSQLQIDPMTIDMEQMFWWIMALAPVAAVVMLIISYLISCAIYERKDIE